MFLGRGTAIRFLASSIALLLAIALVAARSQALRDFLVGMALGLSLALVALVWGKEHGENELKDDGKSVELNISK